MHIYIYVYVCIYVYIKHKKKAHHRRVAASSMARSASLRAFTPSIASCHQPPEVYPSSVDPGVEICVRPCSGDKENLYGCCRM